MTDFGLAVGDLDAWAAQAGAASGYAAQEIETSLLRRFGSAQQLAEAHVERSYERLREGLFKIAVRHLDAARRLGRFDPIENAEMDCRQADALAALGDHEEAEVLWRRCLLTCDEAGEQGMVAYCELRLGAVADQVRDDWVTAHDAYRRGLVALSQVETGTEVVLLREKLDVGLAQVLAKLEDFSAARGYASRAEAALLELLDQPDLDHDLRDEALDWLQLSWTHQGVVAQKVGEQLIETDPVQARERFAVAVRCFRALTDPLPLASALTQLGAAENQVGDPVVALDYFREAVEIFAQSDHAEHERAEQAARIIMLRALALTDPFEAERQLAQFLTVLPPDLGEHRASAMQTLGAIANYRGDLSRADRLTRTARGQSCDDPGLIAGLDLIAALLENDSASSARGVRTELDRAVRRNDWATAAICEMYLPHADAGLSQDETARGLGRARQWISRGPVGRQRSLLEVSYLMELSRFRLRSGAPIEAVVHLEQARRTLLGIAMPLHAAHTGVIIGSLELESGHAHRAMQILVPAAMALDLLRFRLDDADQRAKWAAASAYGLAQACSAALTVGDEGLVAELIFTAQSSGLPVVEKSDQSPLSMLVSGSLIPSAPLSGFILGARHRGSSLAATVSDFVPESGTRLSQPPWIEMPWGLALVAHLDQINGYVAIPMAPATVLVNVHVDSNVDGADRVPQGTDPQSPGITPADHERRTGDR